MGPHNIREPHDIHNLCDFLLHHLVFSLLFYISGLNLPHLKSKNTIEYTATSSHHIRFRALIEARS